jgi:hypothetical protein
MASEDDALIVDQDRYREAETLDALGDLMQLPVRVGPGVLRMRLEVGDRSLGDLEVPERRQPGGVRFHDGTDKQGADLLEAKALSFG